jgi:endonuclease/exonuclease/phosphatase family metal-dependent hydrolase
MVHCGVLRLPSLLVAGFLWCAGSGPPADGVISWLGTSADERNPVARSMSDSLTVVSYNIQFGEEIEQALVDLRGDSRLAGADVYLLQEMDSMGVEALAESLGCQHVYAEAYLHERTGRPFGTAVLSRWPIMSHRAVSLPHPAPWTDHLRNALTADLDIAGRPVRVISVHLATLVNRQQERLEQARTVLDSLIVDGRPVIVGGDFNTVVAYEVILVRRLFRRAGFIQARLTAGPTVRSSLRTRLLRLGGEEPILDHLFVRGLEPIAGGITRGAQASDHYPIWAVFRWPGP